MRVQYQVVVRTLGDSRICADVQCEQHCFTRVGFKTSESAARWGKEALARNIQGRLHWEAEQAKKKTLKGKRAAA